MPYVSTNTVEDLLRLFFLLLIGRVGGSGIFADGVLLDNKFFVGKV